MLAVVAHFTLNFASEMRSSIADMRSSMATKAELLGAKAELLGVMATNNAELLGEMRILMATNKADLLGEMRISMATNKAELKAELLSAIAALDAKVTKIVSDFVSFGVPSEVFDSVINGTEDAVGTLQAVVPRDGGWHFVSPLNQSRWCEHSNASATSLSSYVSAFVSDVDDLVITTLHGPAFLLGAGFFPEDAKLVFCPSGKQSCVAVSEIRCATNVTHWQIKTDLCALQLAPYFNFPRLTSLHIPDVLSIQRGTIGFGVGMQQAFGHMVRVVRQTRHYSLHPDLYHLDGSIDPGMSGGSGMAPTNNTVLSVLAAGSTVAVSIPISRAIVTGTLRIPLRGSVKPDGDVDWCKIQAPTSVASGQYSAAADGGEILISPSRH